MTVVVWGSTATLTAGNPEVQDKIGELLASGVHVSACKACADQLGVRDKLLSLGIEVKYLGPAADADNQIRRAASDGLIRRGRADSTLVPER